MLGLSGPPPSRWSTTPGPRCTHARKRACEFGRKGGRTRSQAVEHNSFDSRWEGAPGPRAVVRAVAEEEATSAKVTEKGIPSYPDLVIQTRCDNP
jgi:hypothetical protein